MTNALNRRQLLALGSAALASPLLTACDDSSDNGPGNLIDVARGQAQFSTLVAAVEAAGLTSTLQGTGPFTLFAPTNEAFAAQACAVTRELGLDPAKVNPNGSGISLGHPIGATGALITVKALYELQRVQGRYALVTMCIGGGQGIAAIFERM